MDYPATVVWLVRHAGGLQLIREAQDGERDLIATASAEDLRISWEESFLQELNTMEKTDGDYWPAVGPEGSLEAISGMAVWPGSNNWEGALNILFEDGGHLTYGLRIRDFHEGWTFDDMKGFPSELP
jgi:hypothetical protein